MPEQRHPDEGDRRTNSLDGMWRLYWAARGADEGFGDVPFTVLVQRRRACGLDRRGVLLTAVLGQQTEDSVEIAVWVDPAIADVEQILRPSDGIYVRQAQSYRGALAVTRAGSGGVCLVGSIAHGDEAFNVRLEFIAPLS